MAHNYLVHIPPYSEFKWHNRAGSSEFNSSRFVEHAHTFLQSIDII